jgi:hypothetical protein
MPPIPVLKRGGPVLDARPDTLDFRDLMYQPTLIEVPPKRDLDEYRAAGVPILDQGQEGACTGFGLATVVHYLLRTRKVVPNTTEVSPRMLYEMAKRYDEFPGEAYSGSSARGAMKGWYRHGVCSSEAWPYVPKTEDPDLTPARSKDAVGRPLGAYLRVNHVDLVAMHSAIAEVGVVYATAKVHQGWRRPAADGVIKENPTIIGGHAFAIVGFDERGLWIQNSWGTGWGLEGFGLVSYDDWIANGTDAWVARLGAPIVLRTAAGVAATTGAAVGSSEPGSLLDVRPHVVSIGNDGLLKQSGSLSTNDADLDAIVEHFKDVSRRWPKKRLLLYAHGGLVGEGNAIQRIANYRQPLLNAQVYPLGFVWHSDFWTTVKDILEDALSQRRPDEGFLQAAKDFMFDRLDDALEPVARMLGGPSIWGQMKQNAEAATLSPQGGARKMLDRIVALMAEDPKVEVHLVGHSAGSIFHGPLVRIMTAKGPVGGAFGGEQGRGLRIETCTMWAPAITVDRFKEMYVPAITGADGRIGRFALFALNDRTEQGDDCANVYHKSLLYLVSNAFEATPHVPFFEDGTPILGMQRFVQGPKADPEVAALFTGRRRRADLVLAPNDRDPGDGSASTSRHHGGFDDDAPTVLSTLARIAPKTSLPEGIAFPHSAGSIRQARRALPQLG